jgi:hypothetical protein
VLRHTDIYAPLDVPHYCLSHSIPCPPPYSPLLTKGLFLEIALIRLLLAPLLPPAPPSPHTSHWTDFVQISHITDTSLSLQPLQPPRETEFVTLKLEVAPSSQTSAHSILLGAESQRVSVNYTVCLTVGLEQEFRHYLEIWEPSQNSRCQKSDEANSVLRIRVC